VRRIKWLLDAQEHPTFGLLVKGCEFEASADLADAFIKAGAAVEVVAEDAPAAGQKEW
jgi:hypothetical protein